MLLSCCGPVPLTWVHALHLSHPLHAQKPGTSLPQAGRWRGVATYAGDPLLRPIASYAVGLLVRPLVCVSRALNRLLRLDVAWSSMEDEDDPPENVLQAGMRWVRRRGFRCGGRPTDSLTALHCTVPGLCLGRMR